jgi:hypothetical protein
MQHCELFWDPSDHKNRITERFSSLVQTESGAAMINGKAATIELNYQHQTCAEIMTRKQLMAMQRKTTVLPTETQIQLHCG